MSNRGALMLKLLGIEVIATGDGAINTGKIKCLNYDKTGDSTSKIIVEAEEVFIENEVPTNSINDESMLGTEISEIIITDDEFLVGPEEKF